MNEPKQHVELGGSAAPRFIQCPGSIRLSRGMPNESSTYATEGTAAHKLAESCLKNKFDAEYYKGWIVGEMPNGADFLVHGDHFEAPEKTAFYTTVDEEMAEAVQLYLDTVRADLRPGCDLVVEHRFDLGWLYPGMGGTNDACVGEAYGTLHVYDYKHGRGVAVDIQDDGMPNAQLAYYALGAAKTGDYSEVELVIVQPRADHPDGPVRRFKMTMDELEGWGQEVLLKAAKLTEQENAPLAVGKYCRFCPAMAICPAQREHAADAAALAFCDEDPVVPQPTERSLPDPAGMSDEDLARVASMAQMVQTWTTAVMDHLKDRLHQGGNVPGWKLVRTRATNKWKDDKQAEAYLHRLLKQNAYEVKLKSVAQARKAFKKQGFDANQLEELIETTYGQTVAPEEDKRPAINAATIYENLEDF